MTDVGTHQQSPALRLLDRLLFLVPAMSLVLMVIGLGLVYFGKK